MAEILAFIAAMCFALSDVLFKKGIRPGNVSSGTFISLLVTFIFSGLILLLRWAQGLRPEVQLEGIMWFVLAGVFAAFIGRRMQYLSISKIGSVRVSSLRNTTPFFTVIIAILFLGEQLTFGLLIGMVLVILGLTVMNPLSSYRELTVNSKVIAGTAIALLSSLAYAIGYAWRKKGLLIIPEPYLGVWIGAFTGIVIYLLLSFFERQGISSIKKSFTAINFWYYGAGLAVSVGQVMYFVALNGTTVMRVSLIAASQSVFTLIISVYIFRVQEHLTKMSLIAGTLILSGAAVILIVR